MSSCVSGSRNFKMAELEEPRLAGIAVAHMGMEKKNEYFYETFFYKCMFELIRSLLSLMRNEFHFRLNCHPYCALLK